MKSAIEAAPIGENAIIEITDNIEIDSQIKITSGQKIIIDLKENSKILTLSTCDNNNAYRTVLHAKKIEEK